MKKEKKFTLEKLQVAKLKNLKQIIGGNNTTNGGNDDTVFTTTGGDGTINDRQGSSGCGN
ncbi:MAG: hypothetical protein A3G95_07500 [Flavobacteria bacterium RIFCSPLOWO2_12_FULL_31_7]|nr:MAG: hypothetical protein A3G95_07500 [Flavobacteria bacterium RIFCSPLOWO2_12_FULL_31_7]